jgi:hypothetical protein
MSEAELLAAADLCAETARQAEVGLLRIAYQWAVVHAPERLDPTESAKPGREKARQLGGPGTPEVCEFAAAELGLRIGRTTYAAAQLMADALDLRHRHPELWRRVEAGEVRASYARHVCAKTRALTEKQAAFVDRAVAQSADGRIPWSRFEVLVEAKVAQADPEAARSREEAASEATFARKLRQQGNGMGTFMVRADLPTIDQVEAAVSALAATLVEEIDDEDQRRVQAVRMLVTPTDEPAASVDDLAPQVHLYLHAYAGPDATGVARLEGHGPVTEAWVTRVLGPRGRFKVMPVIDLAGQAPVDSYEIPDRHRQAVHLMTPADTFPFASSLSRKQQVDHTIPFDEGGESGVGNYGPMTQTHHRIKTHGPMEVRQPFPGIYVWRDRHGAFYLVDHTGTRRVRRPDLSCELYRGPVIELALAS